MIETTRAPELVRAAIRFVVSIALLAAFVYCARTAWSVLGDLGRVSLADVAHAAHVVTVRDAILCVVGWRIGRELLVAIVRSRREA